MSLSLKELEAEALHLPAEQRADLAQRLFASLEDEDTLEDAAEVEQAWIEEAERRYQRYLAGEAQVVPAADALARVRARQRQALVSTRRRTAVGPLPTRSPGIEAAHTRRHAALVQEDQVLGGDLLDLSLEGDALGSDLGLELLRCTERLPFRESFLSFSPRESREMLCRSQAGC